MNHSQQITPTIGLIKAWVLSLAALIITGFVLASNQPIPYPVISLDETIPVGCIYGMLAGGCWVSTGINRRYWRLGARVLMVLAATWLLTEVRERRPWLQSAADLSGLAIVQCCLFFVTRIPAWQPKRVNYQNQPRNDQFGIADIVIVTTAVAVLLAIAIRYSPTVKPLGYWFVLVATWFGGATVTGSLAAGFTSLGRLRAATLILLGLGLAWMGAYAIGIADSIADTGEVVERKVESFVGHYGRIVWGYAGTFALVACLGRFGSNVMWTGETSRTDQSS